MDGAGITGTAGTTGLRRFNLALGSLHLAQGVLMLAISSSFSLPVVANFLYFNERTRTLVPRPETLVEVRIGLAVAAFLFLSSIAHFAVVSPWVYPWYSRQVRLGANPARWIEYSLSSSLMIVIIAMLVGIYDIAALISIFGVNACMILFGWVMERYNLGRPTVDWIAYWFGAFAGVVPWIAIGVYLFGAGAGCRGAKLNQQRSTLFRCSSCSASRGRDLWSLAAGEAGTGRRSGVGDEGGGSPERVRGGDGRGGSAFGGGRWVARASQQSRRSLLIEFCPYNSWSITLQSTLIARAG